MVLININGCIHHRRSFFPLVAVCDCSRSCPKYSPVQNLTLSVTDHVLLNRKLCHQDNLAFPGVHSFSQSTMPKASKAQPPSANIGFRQHGWLGSLVVRVSDLRLNGREFDPRPPHYRSIRTGMTDRPRAGISSRYVTSHPGQLSPYTLWDGKWVPAKVRWCAAAGSKRRMAHSIRG